MEPISRDQKPINTADPRPWQHVKVRIFPNLPLVSWLPSYPRHFIKGAYPCPTMARLSKVALVTLGSLSGVNAWGTLGHATVAYIAQHYVSSSTASW